MPFGIAVSTACWLFGAGPGLNDDFDTSSVHSPGMTLGVWAMASEELTATTNVEASSKCFMATIIVAIRKVKQQHLHLEHGKVLFFQSTAKCCFAKHGRVLFTPSTLRCFLH